VRDSFVPQITGLSDLGLGVRPDCRVSSKAEAQILPTMPDFPIVVSDGSGRELGTLQVNLNKVPKVGSDFEIPGVGLARCREVRIISGDKVIFAVRRPNLP
jgi:hypothetical protein